MLKLVAMSKFFAALFIIFKILTKLFLNLYPAKGPSTKSFFPRNN